MQILPNGQVQITNKVSGESRAVNPSDLPAYGISMDDYNALKKQPAGGGTMTTPQPTGMDVSSAIQPPKNMMQPAQAGQVQPQGTDTTQVITPPDYAKIRSARANDLSLDLSQNGGKHKDAINAYYDALMPSQPELDAAKKVQGAKDTFAKTKGAVQNMLDTYQNLPGLEKGNPLSGFIADHLPSQAAEYESQRKGLAATLKDLAGAGQGSGVRTNQTEMANWANLVPSATKTPAQNQIDIISLDKQLRNTFGQGLDDKYMKTFGVNVDDKGNYTKGKPDHVPVVNRLVGGAVGDVGDIVKGVASIPGGYVDAAMHGDNPQDHTGKLAIAMGKAILNEYGNLAGVKTANGQPILPTDKSVFAKGGFNKPTGMDVGAAVNHAIDHPVNTALDIIPVAKAIGALKGAGAAGEAANAVGKAGEAGDAATAAKGMDVASAVGKPNVVQNAVRNVADVVNGGGASKEYVQRAATNPNVLPQNQVLLDEGILSHPTETGRIQATANSMKKVGGQLADAYNGSDRIFKGTELGDTLDKKLGEAGYDPKAIRMIKTYIGKQGDFDLNSGDNLLTMDKAWKTAQKLEQNPPKIVGTPESAAALKQLSMDAARTIRGELATKVPETLPLNSKYGALRDYFDNGLSDPEGLHIAGGAGHAGGGVINAVLNAGKSAVNPIVNGAYKAAGGDVPVVRSLIRDKRMNVDNPGAFRPKQ